MKNIYLVKAIYSEYENNVIKGYCSEKALLAESTMKEAEKDVEETRAMTEETLNKIVENIKKLEQKRQKESIKNFKMEKYKVYGINK